MSGIAPRRTKAAYDPLMNPGDAPEEDSTGSAPTVDSSLSQPLAKSSLAISKEVKEVPVSEVLAKLALKAGEALPPSPNDGDDPPAQSMAEFLGLSPGGSLKEKQKKLFADDSDEEDEATKERKAKRRAALAAENEAKKSAAEAASNAAAAALNARRVEPEVVVLSARPAHLAQAQRKTQPQKDLFADEEDADTDAAGEQQKGLQGVYIPEGAAEYHTAETKHKVEQIDAKLLEEPDDAEIDELAGLVSNQPKGSAASAASSVSGASATAASASSASTTDELDDDLFSFSSAPSGGAASKSTVDPSAPDFDFSSYIAKSAAPATKAASLFDDDD